MAKKGTDKFRGYFPAVVTPFDADGVINEGAFRENIQTAISDRVHGIVITGTTGEYWVLSKEERKRLFTIAAEEAKGKVTVIGGSTSVDLNKVIEFAHHAQSVGLDGIMIAPPPGALPGRREIVHHYTKINEAVDIDILVYNYMERYGVDIVPTLMSELADLEHIAAVKESCSSFYQQNETLRLCGDRISIMAGWPALRGLSSLVLGADGMIGSIESQVMGSIARDLYDFTIAGDIAAAQEVQHTLMKLHWTVTAAVGSAPAQVKAAMNLVGRPGGFPRLPILPLTSSEVNTVAKALVDLGLEVDAERIQRSA